MNSTIRRAATVVGSLATAGAFALLAAAPASAEVDSRCGRYVCIHVAHHDTFVEDITVYTPDGVPGTLRAFVGDFRASAANTASHRFPVGRDFPSTKYACGGLDRGGRFIENVCITL